MKIQLTRTDKVELLKAIKKGELDTWRVPSLFQCLQGASAFEECMKRAFISDEAPLPPQSDSVVAEVRGVS